MNNFIFSLLLFILLLSCSDNSQKIVTQNVYDNESLFTEEERKDLSKLIYNCEKSGDIQILVLTVSDYGKYQNIEDYAINMGNVLGVGNKIDNNGLVVVISNAKREVRIEPGTGLKEKLSSNSLQKVIDDKMIPYCIKGEFFLATTNMINALCFNVSNQ